MAAPASMLGLVPASLIAGQLYCEYKVDFEVRRFGGRGRSAGLARRIVRRLVVKGGERLARATIIGEVMGVPVVSSPDAIVFTEKYGRRLVEAILKTAIRKTPRPYPGDYVYLYVSAAILDRGMRSDGLKLGVVTATSEDCLSRLVAAIEEGGVKPFKGECGAISVRIYDEAEALRSLEELMGYWKGLRPPKPSPSKFKCRGCIFKSECEYRV